MLYIKSFVYSTYFMYSIRCSCFTCQRDVASPYRLQNHMQYNEAADWLLVTAVSLLIKADGGSRVIMFGYLTWVSGQGLCMTHWPSNHKHSITRLPSNLRQTTRECVYSVTYGKSMNIHSTPLALCNPALIWRMEFPVVLFARRPSVTQCARCIGSCSKALVVVIL